MRGTASDDVITITAYAGDKVTVYGLGGDDKIYGTKADETYIAGPGDDYIKDWSDAGGGGNNTFVYNRGDGQDRIDYYYYGHAPGDGVGKLRFGAGIAPQDIDIVLSGGDVLFSLRDGSGSIRFQRANWGNVYYCPDEIEFADGTVWKWGGMVP